MKYAERPATLPPASDASPLLAPTTRPFPHWWSSLLLSSMRCSADRGPSSTSLSSGSRALNWFRRAIIQRHSCSYMSPLRCWIVWYSSTTSSSIWSPADSFARSYAVSAAAAAAAAVVMATAVRSLLHVSLKPESRSELVALSPATCRPGY